MKTKFNEFMNEEIIGPSGFGAGPKPSRGFELEVSEIPESELIDLFRERGMSCDKKENYQNDIQYDEINNEIMVSFTSYAFNGEMPNDLSKYMREIADILGASDWSFDDPISKVRFFFD